MNWYHESRPARRAHAVVAVCCAVLIALAGFVAVVHAHPGTSRTASHSCSICALAHSGVAPAVPGAFVPAVAHSCLLQALPQTPPSLLLSSTQFIRPPPLG